MWPSPKPPPHPGHLLPLWHVVEDTLITTQGCYLRGFEVDGIDSKYAESAVLKDMAGMLYDAAKRDLPPHLLLQFVLVGSSDYRDVVGRLMAAPEPANPILFYHRRQRLEFLSASNPRRHRLILMTGSMHGMSRKEFMQGSETMHRRKLAEARDLTDKVRQALNVCTPTASLVLRPLSGAAIVETLHATLHAGQNHTPSPASAHMTLREQLLTQSISYDVDHVRIGNSYTQVLTLKDLPATTRFTDMETFFELPFDLRLSVNFRIPPQDGDEHTLSLQRNVSHSYAEGANPHVVSEQNAARAQGYKDLEHEMVTSKQIAFHCGMQVAISGRSLAEMRRRVAIFVDRLKKKGFVFFEETGLHDREVFKTLPGMAVRFDRWRKVLSNNAVDLMPVFGACHGDRDPVFLLKTDRGELFSFNPAEPLRLNWNALILGASGVGKSVVMNMIVVSAMLTNVSRGPVMVVDYAGEQKSSYLHLVKLFGGVFVSLLAGAGEAINPFPNRADATPKALDHLAVFIDLLLGNTGTQRERQLDRVVLQAAIQQLYAHHEASDAPLLRDYLEVLRSMQDPRHAARAVELALLLESFLQSGHAHLFDRQTTLHIDAPFVVIDMHGINDLPEHVKGALAFLVCQYVKGVAFNNAHAGIKYIVLDEVAQLLNAPGMKNMIGELYSTARKHNTSVWTITQEYLSYCKSAVNETITVSSTTQMFFSHQNAARAGERIIDDFAFNPREARLFEHLQTRKGEFSEMLMKTHVVNGPQRRTKEIFTKLRLELSPFDYQLTTSDRADRAALQRLAQQRDDWSLLEVLKARAEEQGRSYVA